MEQFNLVIYINGENDEEEALYDTDRHQLIALGDEYHDKIHTKIHGIIQGIEYAFGTVNLTVKEIYPQDPIFNMLCFYHEE